MANDDTTTHDDASALIGTLLDCAPGDDYDIKRFLADGSAKIVKVRVQVLRVDENHAALIAAQKYAKERGELKDYGDVYREAQAIEVLLRALRLPVKRERSDGTSYYPQLYLTAEQLRQSLTEPEMAKLLNCYELTKARFSSFESLEPEDLDAAIEKLADGYSGAHFLARLDSSLWPELILALARRAVSLAELAGLTLSASPSGSESDPESSDITTTSPSGRPSDSSAVAPSGSDEAVSSTPQLSRQTAMAEARRRLRGKAPPE